jgi:hypothetical protein
MASTNVITTTALRNDFYIDSDHDETDLLREESGHNSPTHRADLCATCGMRNVNFQIRTVAEEEAAKKQDDGDVEEENDNSEDEDEDEDEDDDEDDDDDAADVDRTEYDDVVTA